MTTLTAAERGDLAEDMLPVAARLATIVHGDGGPEDVAQVLGVLDGREKDALIVVLAGLADPDRPLAALLGWVDFDEAAQPVDADHADRTTLRDIADGLGPEDDTDPVDEVAVARFLAGRTITLTRRERFAAVEAGLRRGMSFNDLDRLSGAASGTTSHFYDRELKAAPLRAAGCGPKPRAVLSEDDVLRLRERAAAGEQYKSLAAEFGISPHSVKDIVSGRKWPKVGGPIRGRRSNENKESVA